MKKNGRCRGLAMLPAFLGVVLLPAAAQEEGDERGEAGTASPVVVTATRLEQQSFDLPVASTRSASNRSRTRGSCR